LARLRIGICAYWFNRGQGVVARHLRSALDSLGHETHVLARPTRASNIRPAFVDSTGVWAQPRVTAASDYRIPRDELVSWGRQNQLDLAFFDQNYEFDAIEALRNSGVRTVGRFVWEQFAPEYADAARRALDIVYSLTECERERYAGMRIESPRVRWGIHPELLGYTKDALTRNGGLVFFYPAGFLSKRKPVSEVLRAFGRVPGEGARLIVKGQVERRAEELDRGARRDPRVEVMLEDLPTDEHLRLFASADVCVAPSRWEGLGLHLYESMALGLPVITNDNPPMNEVIRDGANGLLVRARRRGRARSGIPAYSPRVRDLAAAMRRMLDPGLRDQLAAGVREAREQLSWEHTIADYSQLIEHSG
jgi:1,2-diacylglycerol 3-alpha-glucosyltransferase